MGDNASPLGGFLTSFSNGFSNERDRKAMEASQAEANRNRADDRALQWAQLGANGQGQAGGYAGSSAGGGEGADRRASGAAPMLASDPANTTLSPYQRAFLNSVASGESAGKYNVRYTPHGGATFDLAGGHPRVYENGPAGKSSAAGRYQFTWSTWKDIAGADTPFTPENQDKYAWMLAARDYSHRTGRNLDTDLQSGGMTPEIAHALSPTWTSFGSNGGAATTYADSLKRYQTPAPAPVRQAAPQSRSLMFTGQQPVAQDAALGQFPLGQPA